MRSGVRDAATIARPNGREQVGLRALRVVEQLALDVELREVIADQLEQLQIRIAFYAAFVKSESEPQAMLSISKRVTCRMTTTETYA